MGINLKKIVDFTNTPFVRNIFNKIPRLLPPINRLRIDRDDLVNISKNKILESFKSQDIKGLQRIWQSKIMQIMYDIDNIDQEDKDPVCSKETKEILKKNLLECRIKLYGLLDGEIASSMKVFFGEDFVTVSGVSPDNAKDLIPSEEESFNVLEELSELYIKDIAPDFNPSFFLIFKSVIKNKCSSLLKKLKIFENNSDRDQSVSKEIKELIDREEIVIFLPNHVSNFDHLPALFALNKKGIITPVVVAGDNLYKGESGKILPMINVLKLRRGNIVGKKPWLLNPVYNASNREVNNYLMDKNEPLMFYAEGTRSRDGKISKSKVGIIKNLIEYAKEIHKDVYFVPISLAYTDVEEDKDLEKSRKGEGDITNGSLLNQFLSLGDKISHPVHVNFSSPIKISPNGEVTSNGESLGIARVEDSINCNDLAVRVMEEINRGIIKTSTYYLADLIVNTIDMNTNAYFSIGSIREKHSIDYDGEEILQEGIDVFVKKGFIKESENKGNYEILNKELITQYANRLKMAE